MQSAPEVYSCSVVSLPLCPISTALNNHSLPRHPPYKHTRAQAHARTHAHTTRIHTSKPTTPHHTPHTHPLSLDPRTPVKSITIYNRVLAGLEHQTLRRFHPLIIAGSAARTERSTRPTEVTRGSPHGGVGGRTSSHHRVLYTSKPVVGSFVVVYSSAVRSYTCIPRGL